MQNMGIRNRTLLIGGGVLSGVTLAIIATYLSPTIRGFTSPVDSNLEVYIPGVEVGTEIRLPSVDRIGRKIPVRDKCLVIAMSDCTSCQLVTIKSASFTGKSFKNPILAVFPDTKSQRASGWKLAYAIDTEPSFLPSSMRALKPQAAILDGDGVAVKVALGAIDGEQLLKSQVVP